MKYLVTEDEFESANINENGELEFTRDNGDKFVAGVVKSDIPGPAGKDGANVLPTQEAIKQAITEPGEVRDELTSTIAQGVGTTEPSTGKALMTAASGGARSVALTGHSLMYGQDTTTGTLPGVNGASQARASVPTTDAFGAQAAVVSPGAVSVVNQAYPGDKTADAITRWASGTSGDLEVIWIDANDGLLSEPDATTLDNMATLIRRAHDRGSDVVVTGGSPDQSDVNSRKVFAAAQSIRTVAERLGARYVDAGELLGALPRSIGMFSTGVHLKSEGYTVIGARLAALMGPKGINPPKVAPGRIITTRDRLATTNGTYSSRTGSTDGRVWRLGADQFVSIPVEVVEPVIPVFRLRFTGSSGFGLVSIPHNGGTAGRATKYVRVQPGSTGVSDGNGGYSYIVGHPLLSPGPDTITLKREAGDIDVDSVIFLPARTYLAHASSLGSWDYDRGRPLSFSPVGGASAGRVNATWDAFYDIGSATATTLGAAETATDVRWLFDLTLGENQSGVVLAHAVLSPAASAKHMLSQGYFFIRSGTSLIIRKLDNGAPSGSDVTVTDAFPSATGVVRCHLEVHYKASDNTFGVYLDGALLETIADPTWKNYFAGIIAGTASGKGYAAGYGTVTVPGATI
jgi:hypothetical protein